MKQLVDAIREQCPPATWQRAMTLARTANVHGKRTHNDELELRVATKGGMTSPLVVLSPKELDWSCECDSAEAACIHVAAAALYASAAMERGESVTELSSPTVKVAHRLKREAGSVRLDRFLRRGDALTPLHARLTQLKQRETGDLAIAQGDLNVDIALAPMLGGRVPRPVMERVLNALALCTDVTLDDKPITVGTSQPMIRARVEDHPNGFRLVAEQDPDVGEVFDNGAVIHKGVLRPVGELDLSARDVDELRKGRIYEFGQVADLVGRVLPHLTSRMPVTVQSKLLPNATAMVPRLVLQTEYDGEALTVLPTLVYGDPPCARVDAGKLTYLGGQLPLRNERKEERLASDLDAHLGLRVGHSVRFSGLQAVETAERIRRFGQATVNGNGLLACFVAPELKASLDVSGDQFALTFESFGEQEGPGVRHATAEAVLRAFRRGEALVPLTEGGFAPLPADFLNRYGHLVADLVAAKAAAGELSAASAPDLARLCEALDKPPPPAFERLRSLVTSFDGLPPVQLPSDLNATLRPYQLEGVRWLQFLSNANLGGLLADDMGLGKTLQALCVLGTPSLVVCPASVLHNWQREIEKFRPSLRVHTYHGPQRSLDMTANVTLTTYALMRNDAEILAKEAWDTVVLDEAQNIKNADSQVARAAFELNGRFRITLSGTPVENRLQELWSQIHFLNKGLLGGRQDFEERYARPISEGDPVMVDRLRARIRPFLLRRLKVDVAKDLPPRTDVVLRCTLSEHERAVYEAIRAATQQEVLAQLAAGGNVLAALEALLRMRQACCHASLVPGQHGESSSKIDLLLETLDEALAEGHKALVFSQWTSLLDLIEPHFNANKIGFCRLDGSTRDRGAVVDLFQSDDGPPVMLLSLRAGGIGLNLTAADHVFLLDPWWNPAVEDQAADRAHRIGQERPVLVHRIVAADSVEERMLELQEKKRGLAALATGDPRAGAGVTRDDLVALLS